MNDALTGQTVELLQQLIRNRCVNDGTVESGQEVRTTDVLRTYLEGSGLDVEVYEPDGAPGRTSLVARIEGTDPTAPTLCLMGHNDVVPVNPKTWDARSLRRRAREHGEVWGRGAPQTC
jgi:acetylornithine deacetylase/succinyl-diaminopimelate desuccinylase-like protein